MDIRSAAGLYFGMPLPSVKA